MIAPLSGTVNHSSGLQRQLGYVPQRDQLDSIYPLTAADVVKMGATASLPWFAFPTKRINENVAQALTKVGMEAFSDHQFAHLSGGQRQRILIARALATNPVVLVLDEPTAGIDLLAEEQILNFLRSLNEKEQLTILMVSHHLDSLRAAINRVLIVNDDKVQVGSKDDLNHPDWLRELLLR
ncbi:MAG: High-affinity zinc uptake system ATP-binding protein ZnuC [Elusimicrobia bacterium]|nr:High-affinity zinc uptake system ATP-binding protein ZnuC [Elusimicrobiota bacterium]